MCTPSGQVSIAEPVCARAQTSRISMHSISYQTQAVILTNIFTPGTDVYRNDFGRNDNIDGRFDYKTSDMSNGTDANGEFALFPV